MPSLAADRMRQVAAALDDPVWDAVSQWGRAHFLSGTNRLRQYELAVAVADQAPADHLETRGMANLTAALAAAAQGNGDLAETHLTEAAEVAKLIEPDTSPWPSGVMQFGRTNVGTFRVAIGVELGQGPRVAQGVTALLRAEQLAPQQVRTNVWAREAVTGMLSAETRAAGGRELRGLAWRMGIAPTG
jgi:hypothetical protein